MVISCRSGDVCISLPPDARHPRLEGSQPQLDVAGAMPSNVHIGTCPFRFQLASAYLSVFALIIADSRNLLAYDSLSTRIFTANFQPPPPSASSLIPASPPSSALTDDRDTANAFAIVYSLGLFVNQTFIPHCKVYGRSFVFTLNCASSFPSVFLSNIASGDFTRV